MLYRSASPATLARTEVLWPIAQFAPSQAGVCHRVQVISPTSSSSAQGARRLVSTAGSERTGTGLPPSAPTVNTSSSRSLPWTDIVHVHTATMGEVAWASVKTKASYFYGQFQRICHSPWASGSPGLLLMTPISSLFRSAADRASVGVGIRALAPSSSIALRFRRRSPLYRPCFADAFRLVGASALAGARPRDARCEAGRSPDLSPSGLQS